jgi:hypothetical protein
VRKPPRTFTLCALLMLLVAGLWAEYALSRLTDRARSLRSRWRRSEPRRPVPPHPRPWQFPGIGGVSVPVPVPWPKSMPKRPEETVIDECLLVPMGRPFIDYRRNGRWAA